MFSMFGCERFVEISSFPIGLNFKILLKLLISLLNMYLKNLVSILLELLLIFIHFQEILIGILIFIVFLLMVDIKKMINGKNLNLFHTPCLKNLGKNVH